MTLRKNDLRSLLYDTFEIDSFQSKMGEDKDIVTISFSLKEKNAANDLMNFLEKGYGFILDADVTPGEQSDGTHKVFVELERDSQIADNIVEIVDGVKKLSGEESLKFRYYKNFKSYEATGENINQQVPTNAADYERVTTETYLENYKHFFNKSYLDEIELVEQTLKLKRSYANALEFNVVDFVDSSDLNSVITESYNVNKWPEVLFLTKYLGDYQISSYGEKIVVENNNKSLILTRK